LLLVDTGVVDRLRKRFVLLGFLTFCLAPFIACFLVVYFIFRYGEEFYRHPRNIGLRQYTPYARWKFREFNELPHFFNRRINNSYRAARRYMGQYPNEMFAIVAKFTAFIVGSIAFAMIVVGLFSEELLLGLEISPGRTMIWYVGIFSVLLALCRSLIPDENVVFDPAVLLHEVTRHTHYMPSHWRGRLRSDQVRKELGSLFDYRIAVFLREILSVLITPLILWRSLPKCSLQIVDFIREFTVHVDGIGYVCSFAVFDFKKHGNPKYFSLDLIVENEEQQSREKAQKGDDHVPDKWHQSKQGKMEKSFLFFKENFPDWTPNEEGSLFISQLRDFQNELLLQQQRQLQSESYHSSSEHQHITESLSHMDSTQMPFAPYSVKKSPDDHTSKSLFSSYQYGGISDPNVSKTHSPPPDQDQDTLSLSPNYSSSEITPSFIQQQIQEYQESTQHPFLWQGGSSVYPSSSISQSIRPWKSMSRYETPDREQSLERQHTLQQSSSFYPTQSALLSNMRHNTTNNGNESKYGMPRFAAMLQPNLNLSLIDLLEKVYVYVP
jgi:Autophagy protein ATG9